jgi:thiol-disulfide isomerase/thioredoxin
MKAIIEFLKKSKKQVVYFIKTTPLIFLLFYCCYGHAQTVSPNLQKEGQMINDYTFTDIINYTGKKASTFDFRGKWLVLDFWTIGCTGCVLSFPKMNKLAKDYKGKAEIMMVGYYCTKEGTANNKTKDFYAIWAKKKSLTMTAAFDSVSFKQYGVNGVPYILVVNPEGIVVAKSREIDSALLNGFITGKKLPYSHAYSANERTPRSGYNFNLSLMDQGDLTKTKIDTAAYCRSIFEKWDFSMPGYRYYGFSDHNQLYGSKRAELIGFDLPSMLRTAYFGDPNWGWDDPRYTTVNPELILEVKDPHMFGYKNDATGEHTFSYSLVGYGTDSKKKRERLLDDLENSIGFKSKIEVREVPVWKIIVVDKNKLEKIKAKGGETIAELNETTSEYKVKNLPVSQLTNVLIKTLDAFLYYKTLPVVVDATGLKINIDLALPSFYDFSKNRLALRKVGLDIVQETLPMKSIVIQDTK